MFISKWSLSHEWLIWSCVSWATSCVVCICIVSNRLRIYNVTVWWIVSIRLSSKLHFRLRKLLLFDWIALDMLILGSSEWFIEDVDEVDLGNVGALAQYRMWLDEEINISFWKIGLEISYNEFLEELDVDFRDILGFEEHWIQHSVYLIKGLGSHSVRNNHHHFLLDDLCLHSSSSSHGWVLLHVLEWFDIRIIIFEG